MIRELFVEYSDVDLILMNTRLSLQDPNLPIALRLIPSLYRLSFHSAAAPGLYGLSPELRSAIAFHSKSLADVRFSSLHLPISALANFRKLRRLSLHDIFLHADDSEPQSAVSLPILAQLEALELGVTNPYHMPLATSIFLQMQNLKLLSISSGFQCGLPFNPEVIYASAGSIETILWCCQMSNPKRMCPFCLGLVETDLDLELQTVAVLTSLLDVLHNLRSLVLSFQWDHQYDSMWLLDSHLNTLVSYFDASSSSENLEDLTISFHPFSGTDWGDEVVDISTGHGWGDLDVAVSRRCPALTRFQVFFRADSNYSMDEVVKHLQDAMRVQLPSLYERGVLSIGIASIAKVRDDAFRRAGY